MSTKVFTFRHCKSTSKYKSFSLYFMKYLISFGIKCVWQLKWLHSKQSLSSSAFPMLFVASKHVLYALFPPGLIDYHVFQYCLLNERVLFFHMPAKQRSRPMAATEHQFFCHVFFFQAIKLNPRRLLNDSFGRPIKFRQESLFYVCRICPSHLSSFDDNYTRWRRRLS